MTFKIYDGTTNVISIRSTELFLFTANLRKNYGIKSDAVTLSHRNRLLNHRYIVSFVDWFRSKNGGFSKMNPF